MKITRVSVDLAKEVFQLHGVNEKGEAIFKRRLTRKNWIKTLQANAEPGCEIGM